MSLQLAMPLVDVPRARVSDPETSHKAAAKVKSSLGRQQAEVLAYVQRFPGHTSAELAKRMADECGGVWQQYRPMFGRRLSELAVLHIRRGPDRLCTACWSESVTWWPA